MSCPGCLWLNEWKVKKEARSTAFQLPRVTLMRLRGHLSLIQRIKRVQVTCATTHIMPTCCKRLHTCFACMRKKY